MDLSVKTETFGQEDQSWLDSSHGTDSAINATVDITKGFVAGTHYPNGYIPSGTPVARLTAGNWGLYDSSATDGRQTFAGHLLTSQKVTTGQTTVVLAPVLLHGRVNVNRLPIPSAIDAAARTAAAGRITYI